MDDEEYQDRLNEYIASGVVELVGMDEDGELIYSITDKAETEAPELWASHREYVDDALVGLFEKGLITVEYDENLEAILSLGPEGYEEAKKLGLIDFDMDEDIPND
jgi:hypothetical protein